MRGSIANGLEAAVKNVKDNLKVYPLALASNPLPMEFISGTGKPFNTIHDNDINFYKHLNDVIQEEPLEMIDPELRGLFASIGIEKGKEFSPDKRMTRILTDAVAIGNATARSILWYPRSKGSVDNMDGIQVFPGKNSAWIMAWVDKNVFFNGKDGAKDTFDWVNPNDDVTYVVRFKDTSLVIEELEYQLYNITLTFIFKSLRLRAISLSSDFFLETGLDGCKSKSL